MADAVFDPERVFAGLAASNVRFILIGGMAAILHGDAGVTMDVDIVPAYDPENLDRLADALRRMAPRIRAEGAPTGLPFDCSAEFLANLGPEGMLNLTTAFGDVDLTFAPAGTSGFEDLDRDAIPVDTTRLVIRVASLADVIRSKAAADREKDRRALPRLRELLDRSSR